MALEFGLCVPQSCSYPVVDTVFVPFLLGRYMGKDWGPQKPEILTRWHQDTVHDLKEEDRSSETLDALRISLKFLIYKKNLQASYPSAVAAFGSRQMVRLSLVDSLGYN